MDANACLVAAQNGIPSVIVTCGERGLLGYEEGKRHALGFLRRVSGHAEARGVTLVMENINSGHMGGPPEHGPRRSGLLQCGPGCSSVVRRSACIVE